MTRFRKRRKLVAVSFAEHEAEILANLLRNLVELLYDGLPPRATESSDPLAALLDSDGPTSPPEDIVLQRLLPDAYGSDDLASAEFRRFTERGLRDGKITDAKRVLSALESAGADEIALEPDEQLSWLRALNDLRLAIGTRLGIEDDNDYATWEKLPEDDPRRLTYDLYDWLGYLQSALLHNMR
ncbi:DUF2017 domain-containing protein [Kribbella sandramycini]|uniref:DUF2017 domain-containing protein n=1 Tax=Kribbella sandramycini TaxID=60450 RepID=A0A7Y4KWE9_9ACTN|nr:hypothetical protein [Kribbella sandramycini]NOL39923.1 DUF2017 domain-containing protein [Kribbella sandramycini]